MPFQCYPIAEASREPTPLTGLPSRGVACAGALWQLGLPPLQLTPGFTLPWYNPLCSQADDAVWAFCPSAPSHLKCLPVTLLIHVYFYLFLLGTATHMLLFQVAELSFRTWRLQWQNHFCLQPQYALFFFFLCFNKDWFGFLKSSRWCFSYHFLSMAANPFGHLHISWVFIHLIFIRSS